MSDVMAQARKILETVPAKEIAERLGLKSAANIYRMRAEKLPMTEKMARRIVDAYSGMMQSDPVAEREKALGSQPDPARKKPGGTTPIVDAKAMKALGCGWEDASKYLSEREMRELETLSEKRTRASGDRVMKGVALPRIITAVVARVREEMGKTEATDETETIIEEVPELRMQAEPLIMSGPIALEARLQEEANKRRLFRRKR